MTLHIGRCRTRLNRHGQVVLKVLEFFLLLDNLFSEKLILPLKFHDLLRPVLLSEFSEYLVGLFVLHLVLVDLPLHVFDVIIDNFFPEFTFLLSLSHFIDLTP
jgi:hypothetical protein